MRSLPAKLVFFIPQDAVAKRVPGAGAGAGDRITE